MVQNPFIPNFLITSMVSKTKYKILLILFGICFLASLILSFVSIEQACGGTQTGCYAVQTSQYETTFGIKNAYFGLGAYFIIGLLATLQIKHPNKERKALIIAGVVFCISNCSLSSLYSVLCSSCCM